MGSNTLIDNFRQTSENVLEHTIPLALVDEGFEWFHEKWTTLKPTHPQHNAALSVVNDDLQMLMCAVTKTRAQLSVYLERFI